MVYCGWVEAGLSQLQPVISHVFTFSRSASHLTSLTLLCLQIQPLPQALSITAFPPFNSPASHSLISHSVYILVHFHPFSARSFSVFRRAFYVQLCCIPACLFLTTLPAAYWICLHHGLTSWYWPLIALVWTFEVNWTVFWASGSLQDSFKRQWCSDEWKGILRMSLDGGLCCPACTGNQSRWCTMVCNKHTHTHTNKKEKESLSPVFCLTQHT